VSGILALIIVMAILGAAIITTIVVCCCCCWCRRRRQQALLDKDNPEQPEVRDQTSALALRRKELESKYGLKPRT
jgi:hypothetical protein